jgi:hypothetical protein
MGQEGSPGEEPPTTEYVEDVKHREFDDLGKCPGGLVPTLRFNGRGKSHEDVPWGGGKRRRISSKEREEKCPGENMVVRGQEAWRCIHSHNQLDCRGRPPSSYYFVGFQADNIFYLDPHRTRATILLRPPSQTTTERERVVSRLGNQRLTGDLSHSPVIIVRRRPPHLVAQAHLPFRIPLPRHRPYQNNCQQAAPPGAPTFVGTPPAPMESGRYCWAKPAMLAWIPLRCTT